MWFWWENNHAAKITSTCFTWKTSRCNFGGQNKKLRELFPVHEIKTIDGMKVFQNIENVFWIGGNIFYDRKNQILIKTLAGKRSRSGIVVEFCRILSGFPNQGWYCRYELSQLLLLLLHHHLFYKIFPHTELPWVCWQWWWTTMSSPLCGAWCNLHCLRWSIRSSWVSPKRWSYPQGGD